MVYVNSLLTKWNRTNDEAALRNKVNEALNVYDEYMTNKDGPRNGVEGSENEKPKGEAESKA